MARKHMASCGAVGATGVRIGTIYAHTPEECWEIMGKPWFRFRSDEDRNDFFSWQDTKSTAAKEGEKS